jgi:type IV pilus assembly protein PilA
MHTQTLPPVSRSSVAGLAGGLRVRGPVLRSRLNGFTLVEIMIVVVIIGLLAAMAIPSFNKVRTQSRLKAVTNNLRQFASAAQEYMLDKGATQASYTDIVGTFTDAYIRTITPVAGENYTSLVVQQTSTQISLSSTAIGTVTFNL